MLGINGKPFISLDHLFDPNQLMTLHEEIIYGLAMTEPRYSEGREWSRGDATEDIYDHRFKDIAIGESELTEAEKALMEKMNPRQKARYLMYAKGVYYPWCAALSLLQPLDWYTKHSGEGKTPTPLALQWFPKTLDFAHSLPMFKEIGRITIFGIYPAHHGTVHRDDDIAHWVRDHHFIMFSPLLDKPAFIYDELTKTRYYPEHRAYMFNDFDYHGSDATSKFTYSFRVDGTFTNDFAKDFEFGRVHR